MVFTDQESKHVEKEGKTFEKISKYNNVRAEGFVMWDLISKYINVIIRYILAFNSFAFHFSYSMNQFMGGSRSETYTLPVYKLISTL